MQLTSHHIPAIFHMQTHNGDNLKAEFHKNKKCPPK